MKKLKKGDATRTMMHTAVANEVIEAVTAFVGLQCTPTGMVVLKVNGDKAVLQFPERKLTYGTVNGTLKAHWIFALPEPAAPGL